jgi:hypothetical protein
MPLYAQSAKAKRAAEVNEKRVFVTANSLSLYSPL